ncbi:glycosyltransferase family 9 protein [Shewanella maritima]|uniref:glycosyltransferase family 9 protein n=1 Tax=Shewanella maritima TaxID=2520507 RepID=UPI003735645E
MKRILYIRTDKIGDFVTKWPAIAMLKLALPDASIEVFVSPVVASLARACPYIDYVIEDKGTELEISQFIQQRNYDAIIVSSSHYRTYKLSKQSRANYVIAPAVDWVQYLFKNRVNLSADKNLPGFKRACLLVEHFLADNHISIPELPQPIWDISNERARWRLFYGAESSEQKLVFVHVASGGSSHTLSSSQFAELITSINKNTNNNVRFMLTFGRGEEVIAEEVQAMVTDNNVKVSLAPSISDLADFSKSIVAADLFIAGSTGSLHIAGLHNIPTVGFYHGRRSGSEVKWQTMSDADKRLHFTPPVGKLTGKNMSLIDIPQAGAKIAKLLTSKQTA